MFAIKKDLHNAIRERLELLRDEIRNNMETFNENATGNTSRSLEVVEGSDVVALIGGGKDCAPLSTLESGYKGFVQVSALFEWSKAKGISFNTDRERWRFSYALQKKIEREGTQRYNEHVDVYTTEVSYAVEDILEICEKVLIDGINSTL